jgi:hypothetical protein
LSTGSSLIAHRAIVYSCLLALSDACPRCAMTNKARGRLRLLGEVVIKELQEQGRYECELARFSIDHDFPHEPAGDRSIFICAVPSFPASRGALKWISPLMFRSTLHTPKQSASNKMYGRLRLTLSRLVVYRHLAHTVAPYLVRLFHRI